MMVLVTDGYEYVEIVVNEAPGSQITQYGSDNEDEAS